MIYEPPMNRLNVFQQMDRYQYNRIARQHN